ncbi:hypothetical protein NQ318_000104 [Aromia moschata]|uniref:Transposable element Tc3 transposase n=1 Tax=Aromia moschata TaxID=1265417 RepID=A0AAV8XFW9_9CUCU|nr:hypothetical protein NQ318_000104 [Aromia moschata]
MASWPWSSGSSLEDNLNDNLALADYRNIFYQHDGAPPHNGHLINNHLPNLFYDQWIANNGPHLWLARSPDLSVLDFFIWGTIKNKVYNIALTTRKDCMRRVRTAFQDLDPQSIRRATMKIFCLDAKNVLKFKNINLNIY